MKKKAFILIGSLGILYLLLAYVLPFFVAVPFAAYNSKQVWIEHEIEYSESKSSKIALDSIGPFPVPIGSVSDYEKIFTESQISNLTQIVSEYEEKTTREIAVVTINSIEPYENIDDYTTDLGNAWGIGKAETNNGLLILFSTNLREIRISTGYGTEKILTDEICKRVIDQTIIPEFKRGEYYTGIKKGIGELIKKWD